jgi:hypothetical protein
MMADAFNQIEASAKTDSEYELHNAFKQITAPSSGQKQFVALNEGKIS